MRIPADACGFGYRESHFKHEWQQSHIITAVGLRLPKQWQPVASYGPLRDLGEQPTPMQIFETICRLRRAGHRSPELLGNAGSFFQNPTVSSRLAARLTSQFPAMPRYPQADGEVKLAAGWLIEQAGLKGLVMGRAVVHAEQALVLVNRGGAQADEILTLARHVRAEVLRKFAVELVPEVRFIGTQGEILLDAGG